MPERVAGIIILDVFLEQSMVTTRYFDQRQHYKDAPDVFTFDELPDEFRVKVAYALVDTYVSLGAKMRSGNERVPQNLWEHRIVRALGTPGIPGRGDLFKYFYDEHDLSRFFIGVEVALLAAIISVEAAYSNQQEDCAKRVTELVETINTLLRYFALGYEIVVAKDDPLFQVIRKDTEFTHSEMVKPVLRLLTGDEFSHANKQFRDAHQEFQRGAYDDAITDAGAALETVLKVVLDVEDGTAKELLRLAGEKGYFPSYLLDSTNNWVNFMLELATVRNKFGDAHGRGASVPDKRELERLARLALNLAAAHILFIIDEYERRRETEDHK